MDPFQAMTVPQTRRALLHLRGAWRAHSQLTPIDLCATVPGCGRTVAEFAMQFTLGEHRREQPRRAPAGARPA